ncbi:MAG: tyrosine-type recombinase/integrase [Rhodocyclaceae bacterium]|nr:tyrosine-type recombinase/integrase [Rhodocyclaceae bacterium]MDZ4213729.1 tyrosine-type recombinase/integrase [Rhodocyclaceae bacterium]
MTNRFRFLKAKIETLTAPETGRTTYYDAEVQKLALRVTAAGSKTFYVVKRADEGMVWVKLGTFPDMTIEQARNEATKKLSDFATGKNPAKIKREEKQKLTFGQAFDQYMKLYAGPRGIKTADDMRALWERCLGPMPDLPAKKHGRKRVKHPGGVDWSGRKLDQIENKDVRALHAKVAATTPVLANRVIELVSSIYNRAKEWGYVGTNPATDITPFKETKRDRFIRHDELPRFFKALEADTSVDFKHFVLLSLLTGVRRGNVLAARWEEINLEMNLWRVPDTKNGDPLNVPLVPEAVAILQERNPQAQGFIFAGESATGHISPPKERWRKLLERAGLEDFTIHDLRRSLGSWQAIGGASLAVIGKSLGHKSADATMIYARLSIDPVRQSVTSATSAMLTAAGVKKPAEVTPLKRRRRQAAATP